MFIVFGALKKYKNAPKILESFLNLPDHNRPLRLIFAGRPIDQDSAEILQHNEDSRVKLYLEFIELAKLNELLAISDVAVYAFSDIMNSGSVIHGMSAGLVVVAPDLGCVSEVVPSNLGVLYDIKSPNALADAMEKSLSFDFKNVVNEAVKHTESFDWDTIGKKTKDVYTMICKH